MMMNSNFETKKLADYGLVNGESLFSVEISVSDITTFGWQVGLRDPDYLVRFVRGAKSDRVEKMFDEVSAALQFPYYFGENWAAFDECISDLEWLKGKVIIIVVTDADNLLGKEPTEEMANLFDCMANAISELGEQKKEMKIVFQINPDSLASEFYARAKASKASILQLRPAVITKVIDDLLSENAVTS